MLPPNFLFSLPLKKNVCVKDWGCNGKKARFLCFLLSLIFRSEKANNQEQCASHKELPGLEVECLELRSCCESAETRRVIVQPRKFG